MYIETILRIYIVQLFTSTIHQVKKALKNKNDVTQYCLIIIYQVTGEKY